MRAGILAAVVLVVAVGTVNAGGRTWTAPAVGPVQEEVIGPIPVSPSVDYVRPNPYDVWQLYAVDNYGRFRPRIGLSPDGPRYLYNNAPFSWWPEYNGEQSRFISQPANFGPAIPTVRPPAGYQPVPAGVLPSQVVLPLGPAPVPVRNHHAMPRCEE